MCELGKIRIRPSFVCLLNDRLDERYPCPQNLVKRDWHSYNGSHTRMFREHPERLDTQCSQVGDLTTHAALNQMTITCLEIRMSESEAVSSSQMADLRRSDVGRHGTEFLFFRFGDRKLFYPSRPIPFPIQETYRFCRQVATW
jgi:hypothetical protein